MTARLTPDPGARDHAYPHPLHAEEPDGLRDGAAALPRQREIVIRARFAFRRRPGQRVWSLLASSPVLRRRTHFEHGEVVIAGPGASLDEDAWAACYATLREVASLCYAGRAEIASEDDFFARIHATG